MTAGTVTHPMVSGVSDGADTSKVRPTNWNANHTLSGALAVLGVEGAALTSAATLVPGTDGDTFHVTGATGPITAITPSPAWDDGRRLILIFDSTPTLTHNGTSLILQDAANHVCAAGEVFVFRSEGSGNWREIGRSMAAAFDTTVPVTQAFGDAAAAGTAKVPARRDHVHGMPAAGTTLTINKAEVTGDQGTTSTSFVDLTSLTFSTNTSGTNKTRIEFWAPMINDSASALVVVQILVDTVMKQISTVAGPGVNYLFAHPLMRDYLDQATGAKVVKAQFKVNGGTGTMYLTGAGGAIAQLVHHEYENLG